MNRVFSNVWDEITRTCVAVAEHVKRRRKTSGSALAPAQSAKVAQPGLQRPRPMLLALEARVMFDGAAVSTAADMFHPVEPIASPDTSAHAEVAIPADVAAREITPPAITVREGDPAQNGGRKEVAFIDTAVADYQSLVAGVRAGVEVVLIDASQNGLTQMAEWSQSHCGYDAIHVLSHGAEGTLLLGRDTVTQASLANAGVQAELAHLGQALTARSSR